jgi:hypothetical protein
MDMQVKNDGFGLARIRETDMAGFLKTLGFLVAREAKGGTELWYLSPFSNERTASFHVNRLINSWYDFPSGTGGNMIDFCLRYYGYSISGLLDKFNTSFSPRQLPVFDASLHEGRVHPAAKLMINSIQPLYRYPLKNYLHERSIPVAVADVFCKEVDYQINGLPYYGIGFKNDAGGWEIRNKTVKLSSSPKDISCLGAGTSTAHVFEGFMDFLSYRTLYPYEDPRSVDYIILNGAGLFDRAIPFLEKHERVHLWLDNDVTGFAYKNYALTLGSKYSDASGLYGKFKDLNDWLRHKGELPKPVLRQGHGLRTMG